MKNGVKNSNALVIKVLLVIIYFVLFTMCFTLTMYAISWCIDGGSFLRVLLFLGLLSLDIIFLLIFLATWESCFESKDEH